jgi:nitrogen fixation NifU-like protein
LKSALVCLPVSEERGSAGGLGFGEDLYKDIILDHSSSPRCHGTLEHPTHSHVGLNPLCGDEVELQFVVRDGVIEQVRFKGDGCAISQASASMFAQQAKGKTVAELRALTETFRSWMRDRELEVPSADIGDLEALAGVRRYPARIKCALLAWTTAEQALKT